MYREQAKELLPIIQAFAEGKEIQCSLKGKEDWDITEDPTWDRWIEYRVKPQQSYRPFNNAKEFIEALNEHGGWMRVKNENFYVIPSKVKDNVVSNTGTVHSYCDILNRFVFYDGTPCGIEE